VSGIALYIHRLNQRLRQSEARYRVVYENAPVAFMLWDHQLNVTGWNRHAETIFGWRREEMMGREFMSRLVPGDQDVHCRDVIHELVAKAGVVHSTNWNVTRDGGRILCEWMNTALRDGQGRVIGFASLAVDVTERHRAEEALRASEQKFRLLAENALDVIWTLDFDGRITYVSPSVERLRGFKPEEIVGQTMQQALTPESYKVAREALTHLRAHGELPSEQYTFEQPCKDGSTVWTDMTVNAMRGEDGTVIGFLGITRDITRQRETEERLTHMAHHDPLTDLPNRALFFDRLNMGMARALREELPLALLYVDLDGFKDINDEHGHQVGDFVLSQVASRLRRSVREMDTVARIGGDEFTVVITGVREADTAYQIADKIIAALSAPIELGDGQSVQIGASIGLAFYPTDAQTSDALLRKADQAMYTVKRGGKGAYHHPGAED
jgi:diguanylate cyclase (GGDEF)-like protein/PAS domain S-box-containing protein